MFSCFKRQVKTRGECNVGLILSLRFCVKPLITAMSAIIIIYRFLIEYSLFKLQNAFIFSRGDEILLNKEIGYMVRTKTTEHDEGGISSGSAAFDSPYMV